MSLAVGFGHTPPLDILRELLKHPSIDVNAPGGSGSPLMKAALQGQAAALALLLQHPGINVNATLYGGNTVLHLAAQYGDLSVVRELLKHPGVDLGLRNSNGMTAHQMAQKSGRSRDYRGVVGAIAAAMAR